jgi:hypothetical protein
MSVCVYVCLLPVSVCNVCLCPPPMSGHVTLRHWVICTTTSLWGQTEQPSSWARGPSITVSSDCDKFSTWLMEPFGNAIWFHSHMTRIPEGGKCHVPRPAAKERKKKTTLKERERARKESRKTKTSRLNAPAATVSGFKPTLIACWRLLATLVLSISQVSRCPFLPLFAIKGYNLFRIGRPPLLAHFSRMFVLVCD